MYNKLIIDRIPRRFNEGLFLGNGCIGCLVYIKGSSLRFSVDHMKLWEVRDTTDDEPGGTFKDFIDYPEKFHNGSFIKPFKEEQIKIWRTRLPGLSVDINLHSEITGFYGELFLDSAESKIKLSLADGSTVNCMLYIDSNQNILKVEIDRDNAAVNIKGWEMDNAALSVLKKWGYVSSMQIRDEDLFHAAQPYSESGMAVISLLERKRKLYISLNAEVLNGDRAALMKENTELLKDYEMNEDDYKKQHVRDWEEYYKRCAIHVPNERLMHAFYMETYKIYANIRKDTWPVPLSGVWNNDMRMPSWYGDWHNDLNIQSCYWPVYKTNHIELAQSYIDYYTGCINRLTERAFKLFGIKDAIHCPVMMGPLGYGVGGEWCFWNLLLGPELFVAVDFIWYYEFSKDDERLKNCIYPFIRKVIRLYQGIANEGEDGFLHIPFCNTPEVFKDGRMLIKDDATFVISTLHYVLEHMIEYGGRLSEDVSDLKEFKKKLIPVKTTDKGYPLFPDEDLFESHRHFCQMFPIYPLGMDVHSPLALKSLETIIDKGYLEYASWSFPYLSIFAARCGRGNMARTLLEMYCMAFRARNSFVVNGDPNHNGILKVSETNAGEHSDAFTVEAGFIVVAAMSEMFVHRSYKDVYIAYGIPDEWSECSCRDMTIEGGHRVSVEISHYAVEKIIIHAEHDEVINLHVNLKNQEYLLNGSILSNDDIWEINMKKGESYRILKKCNSSTIT